jgi:hypothetical protein
MNPPWPKHCAWPLSAVWGPLWKLGTSTRVSVGKRLPCHVCLATECGVKYIVEAGHVDKSECKRRSCHVMCGWPLNVV